MTRKTIVAVAGVAALVSLVYLHSHGPHASGGQGVFLRQGIADTVDSERAAVSSSGATATSPPGTTTTAAPPDAVPAAPGQNAGSHDGQPDTHAVQPVLLEPEIRQALGKLLNTTSEGLVEKTHNGVTSVDLQRHFRTAPVATVDAQGNVSITDYTHLPAESAEPAVP